MSVIVLSVIVVERFSSDALSLNQTDQEVFLGIFQCIINFAGRNSEAAMGGREQYIFRVLNNSFRVQFSSQGCSVAQKGASELRRVQLSSEGASYHMEDSAIFRGVFYMCN